MQRTEMRTFAAKVCMGAAFLRKPMKIQETENKIVAIVAISALRRDVRRRISHLLF